MQESFSSAAAIDLANTTAANKPKVKRAAALLESKGVEILNLDSVDSWADAVCRLLLAEDVDSFYITYSDFVEGLTVAKARSMDADYIKSLPREQVSLTCTHLVQFSIAKRFAPLECWVLHAQEF